MTRTLGLVAVLCLIFGSEAYAGHGRGGGGGFKGGGGGGGRVVVRDHRSGPAPVYRGGGPVVRDHRGPGPARGARVRVTNGRYVFPGGVVRVYNRPVIRTHYYNVHVRPPIIVEAYDPVPGYIWVGGAWTWGGGEWIWTPGYWAVAEEPAPVISGGIGISAGVTIH